MSDEKAAVCELFKFIVRCGLVEQNAEKVLSVVSDDVIGIGMGTQGIVDSKDDVAKIIRAGKKSPDGKLPEIIYENLQIRCFENRFATVCGVVKIRVTAAGKTVESTLGQMMNMRKENGVWLAYTIQATPLFNEIEEMEAYPIKFAENVLEKYRQQEQIAKNAQNDSVGIYHINYTEGVFEDVLIKTDMLVPTRRGEMYEQAMFEAARKHLNEEDRYKFMSLFSLGNVYKCYESGQTELSMEYEMFLPNSQSIWMKTVVRLYTDKTGHNLKGYLYVMDINEEKQKELALVSKAEQDPLTELYNKKSAEQKISERLKSITPANQGAFFMIDLDHFKNINDTYGHKEGDRVIHDTAKCIRALIRKNDIAGRVGGDEFCVFFHGELTQKIIREKAAGLCQEVRKIIPGMNNGTSCSIGIVFCTSPETSFEELYQKADLALYEQKKGGRNGYRFFAG